MKIDLSNLRAITNEVHYPLYTCQSRYLILYGGAGSGKSRFACQKWLVRILAGMTCNIIHKFLFLRKTSPAARKSVYALTKWYVHEWGLEPIVDINKTEMSFSFKNGSEILCSGLDDPEKLKSIEGITGEWMEEATEFAKDDFKQLNLRLRGKTARYKQIIMTFNPIDAMHWINKYFFEGQHNLTTINHSTWRDNRFIDKEYIDILKDLESEDENYYNIYSEGKWGVLRNVIYSNYEIIAEGEWPTEFDEVIYGEDFGFNNPSGLLFIGIRDQEIYLEELIYKTGLTNTALIDEMKSVIPEKYRSKSIFCDSAEPARIKEIRLAGFNAMEADKSVKDGVDFVKRKHLKIHPESTNLIKEIKGYKYKEDKNGNVLEEPVKFNDHLMDPLRYGLYTYYRKPEPIIYTYKDLERDLEKEKTEVA